MERYIILMSIKVVYSFLEKDLFMRERVWGGGWVPERGSERQGENPKLTPC